MKPEEIVLTETEISYLMGVKCGLTVYNEQMQLSIMNKATRIIDELDALVEVERIVEELGGEK